MATGGCITTAQAPQPRPPAGTALLRTKIGNTTQGLSLVTLSPTQDSRVVSSRSAAPLPPEPLFPGAAWSAAASLWWLQSLLSQLSGPRGKSAPLCALLPADTLTTGDDSHCSLSSSLLETWASSGQGWPSLPRGPDAHKDPHTLPPWTLI